MNTSDGYVDEVEHTPDETEELLPLYVDVPAWPQHRLGRSLKAVLNRQLRNATATAFVASLMLGAVTTSLKVGSLVSHIVIGCVLVSGAALAFAGLMPQHLRKREHEAALAWCKERTQELRQAWHELISIQATSGRPLAGRTSVLDLSGVAPAGDVILTAKFKRHLEHFAGTVPKCTVMFTACGTSAAQTAEVKLRLYSAVGHAGPKPPVDGRHYGQFPTASYVPVGDGMAEISWGDKMTLSRISITKSRAA